MDGLERSCNQLAEPAKVLPHPLLTPSTHLFSPTSKRFPQLGVLKATLQADSRRERRRIWRATLFGDPSPIRFREGLAAPTTRALDQFAR